jgi:formylglycine-generating enzyme required for sulfatase activity
MKTRLLSCAAVAIGLSILSLLSLSPGHAEPAAAAPRLALVIANATYKENNTSLASPSKSAQSLATELRLNAFDVDLEENLDKNTFQQKIETFAAKIRPGSTVLFFFSGFGIQAGSASYLIPVDAQIWSEADLKRVGISLQSILGLIDDHGAKTKFAILDASRRNPFERRFRSFSSGLGKIDIPPGSLIISAAAPGQVIADAEGDSSLLIGELLKEMRSRDLTAEDIFKKTKLGVSRASNGEQIPWIASTLTEDLRFGPSAPKPKLVQSAAPAAASAPPAQIGIKPEDIEAGALFRDCTECPELIVVPAGAFEMGSSEYPIERPIHHVMIGKPFAMSRYEVTFSQWDACVAEHGCSYRPDDQGRGRTNLPVSDVSWSDAQTYVAWLSKTTGYKYRLPSEAEWEYAARGGTTGPFWWGDASATSQANCRDCGPGLGEQTMPVGSFPANGFGLADTAGNIAEWVADCWTDSYKDAPKDGSAQVSDACKHRVLRGGSFDSSLRYMRSSSRFLYDAGVRYYTNGFRVLRELP